MPSANPTPHPLDAAARRQYRWIEDEDAPKRRRRVLVRYFNGVAGYEVHWTDACTGCSELGDYGSVLLGSYDAKGAFRGIGCEECGYTGKRRMSYWLPFNIEEYDRACV